MVIYVYESSMDDGLSVVFFLIENYIYFSTMIINNDRENHL